MARNRESLGRIIDLDADRIVFSHGPEIPEPNKELRALLAGP
jgi:glyoxylase-like metal-dependent hydrolase (beta-lactamase superfamily II)